MTKTMMNVRRTALCLAVLLVLALLAPRALAAEADTVEIGEDGTVSVLSARLAGEKVSSVQVRINVGAAEGETVGFAFDGGLAGRLTYSSYRDGVLSVYVAGTAQLLADGQDRLVLGAITGADLAGAVLAEDGLQYVYGRRVIAQSAEMQVYAAADDDPGPGEEPESGEAPESGSPEQGPGQGGAPDKDVRDELRAALEAARAVDPSGFTEKSVSQLSEAAAAAEALLADPNAAAEDLDAALARLQKALDRLVPVADADGSGPVIGDGPDDGTGAGEAEPEIVPLPEDGTGDVGAADVPAVQENGGADPETESGGEDVPPEDTDGGTAGPEKDGGEDASGTDDGTVEPAPSGHDGGAPAAAGEPSPETAAPSDTEAPARTDTGQGSAPHTGDDAPVALWTAALCLAASGLLGALLLGRRRQHRR